MTRGARQRRRCRECGRFLGPYIIVSPVGISCPSCGPKIDGGQIQRDAQAMLRAAASYA
jgi:hypothetical protein